MLWFATTAARRSCAVAGLATLHYAVPAPRAEAATPGRLRFGLVADVQYCDIPDAQNYGGTLWRNQNLTASSVAVSRGDAAGCSPHNHEGRACLEAS